MSDMKVPRAAAISEWLQANVAGAIGPFTFEQIIGGHSNITFKVAAAASAAETTLGQLS